MPGLSCSTQDLQSSLQHVESLVVACKLLVVAWGIQFPNQGSNPGPLHWEHRVLASGPLGKSPSFKAKALALFYFPCPLCSLTAMTWLGSGKDRVVSPIWLIIRLYCEVEWISSSKILRPEETYVLYNKGNYVVISCNNL